MQTHNAQDWVYINNPKNDLPDILKQIGVTTK